MTTASQLTLCIIKPDAVQNRHHGRVLQRILDEGFDVVAMRQLQLSPAEAGGFYAVHSAKPFFDSLVETMTGGPIIVVALRRKDAVEHWRSVIGATDPTKAEPGTLRSQLAKDITHNSVHGSDSEENGVREVSYFFPGTALLG